MCRLIETIKILNGIIYNIDYHNKRLNNTRKELFNSNDNIDLYKLINIPKNKINQPVKCRIIYNQKILKIEYIDYKMKMINSLKLIYDNKINYQYKFENRSSLNNLFMQKGGCDDILIVKENRITDTSFSNVVLFDGNKWFTPQHPLLKGTERHRLLDEYKIHEKDIMADDLKHYVKIRIINSMINFKDNIDVLIINVF